MIRLNSFKIDKVLERISKDDLMFLNLSGKRSYHSQGIYGQDTIVAVVDTGVNPHPELRENLLRGPSFVNYTDSPYDDNGHGTHVAASIAGKNVGIAPMSKILPVKVLDKDGNGEIENLIESLDWISDFQSKTGRKVAAVNMSLSSGKEIGKKEINKLHKSIKNLVDNDIAVIVSSGNTSKEEVRYPAAYQEVISVGAVDFERNRAMFSTMGEHVDVCQIGVNVLSAWHKGGYAVLSGTSMSTAIVSGIAALIASKYKQVFGEDITEDYLWKTLKLNTKDLGIKGADREYGVGFCTLQPLEANMRLRNNSPVMLVNGKSVNLNKRIKLEDGFFELPAMVFDDITGAYRQLNEDTKSMNILY